MAQTIGSPALASSKPGLASPQPRPLRTKMDCGMGHGRCGRGEGTKTAAPCDQYVVAWSGESASPRRRAIQVPISHARQAVRGTQTAAKGVDMNRLPTYYCRFTAWRDRQVLGWELLAQPAGEQTTYTHRLQSDPDSLEALLGILPMRPRFKHEVEEAVTTLRDFAPREKKKGGRRNLGFLSDPDRASDALTEAIPVDSLYEACIHRLLEQA
ncbi:hypothetical protein LZ31DRAFT_187791 [Colletotrichum somersetense]|nr:hypothetical protein LZ31DRAFT_187791 [Colletotrichum somersetense]